MKKVLSRILVFTMLISLLIGMQVNAASGNFTITASGPATIQSTDTANIDILIDIAGVTESAPMGPITIKMNFDNTKFTLVNGTAPSTGGSGKPKFTKGTVLTTAFTESENFTTVATDFVVNGTTTKVAATLTPGSAINANGNLGKFTFTPIAPITAGNTEFAIVVSASDTNANDGTTPPNMHTITGVNQTINVQSGSTPADQTAPASSLFTATAPTVAGNDGSIAISTTVTATNLEYKLTGASAYTGCTSSTIANLAAGTYLIRYKAKTGYNASADTSVIVPAYVPVVKQYSITGGILPTDDSGFINVPITIARTADTSVSTGEGFTAGGTKYALVTYYDANHVQRSIQIIPATAYENGLVGYVGLNVDKSYTVTVVLVTNPSFAGAVGKVLSNEATYTFSDQLK